MVTRYRIVYPDELNHYGVKGMKWGVRKDKYYATGSRATNIGYYRAKKYQKLSQDNRLKIAQKHGTKAFNRYNKISNKYNTDELSSKIFDSSASKKDRDAAYKKLIKIEKKQNKLIDKKVIGYLYRKGYTYVSRGGGSNGYKNIQFGRDLVNSEKTKFGERYVDDYFIDTTSKRVTRSFY